MVDKNDTTPPADVDSRQMAKVAIDLAPLPVTNRGFGGSKTEDQLFFFDQIVPSSRASLVIWYCGSNDINATKTPDSILQNTKEWIGEDLASGSKVFDGDVTFRWDLVCYLQIGDQPKHARISSVAHDPTRRRPRGRAGASGV